MPPLILEGRNAPGVEPIEHEDENHDNQPEPRAVSTLVSAELLVAYLDAVSFMLRGTSVRSRRVSFSDWVRFRLCGALRRRL